MLLSLIEGIDCISYALILCGCTTRLRSTPTPETSISNVSPILRKRSDWRLPPDPSGPLRRVLRVIAAGYAISSAVTIQGPQTPEPS